MNFMEKMIYVIARVGFIYSDKLGNCYLLKHSLYSFLYVYDNLRKLFIHDLIVEFILSRLVTLTLFYDTFLKSKKKVFLFFSRILLIYYVILYG